MGCCAVRSRCDGGRGKQVGWEGGLCGCAGQVKGWKDMFVQLKEWKDMFSTKSDNETRVHSREAKDNDGAVQSHSAVSNVVCVR